MQGENPEGREGDALAAMALMILDAVGDRQRHGIGLIAADAIGEDVAVAAGGPRIGDGEGVEVEGIGLKGEADAAEVGRAVGAVGHFLGLAQSRQHDGNQERDDGHDNQQFDEGEAANSFAGAISIST